MPKRRRLTPMKSKNKITTPAKNRDVDEQKEQEVNTARGRLKGALMGMMEPPVEESDNSSDFAPAKREKKVSSHESSDEEDSQNGVLRQSYVLKLFDRSVELSQFSEDTPLYPICRAWIVNQPRADYKKFANKEDKEEKPVDGVELPGPEGPVVSRIPQLLPEQLAANKDNINLNYREPAPGREQLLQWHAGRWAGVRRAWLAQARRVHRRYAAAQSVLHRINVNAL
ncbi:protein lin-37 homolog [Zerene cesonia]|uniref:protein lin-37 homolog n=1 Tax=Zerene cesonia TaxID=33412 RepID=UPI0018E51A89|nr:protein lin-37 homolog [Zerene cesonia]